VGQGGERGGCDGGEGGAAGVGLWRRGVAYQPIEGGAARRGERVAPGGWGKQKKIKRKKRMPGVGGRSITKKKKKKKNKGTINSVYIKNAGSISMGRHVGAGGGVRVYFIALRTVGSLE